MIAAKLAAKVMLQRDFDFAIQNTSYTNSRSILFSCDTNPKNPQSSIANTAYLDSIPQTLDGPQNSTIIDRSPIIYVASDGISYFTEYILDKITSPFLLATGDSDLSINPSTLGQSLETLLSNPKLLRWHAQNKDVQHTKMQSTPIASIFITSGPILSSGAEDLSCLLCRSYNLKLLQKMSSNSHCAKQRLFVTSIFQLIAPIASNALIR